MRFPKQPRISHAFNKNTLTDSDRTIRAFFAVDLEPAVKERLRVMQLQLKPYFGDLDVNWVRTDHLHLTLRFLGNISHEQIKQIVDACGFISMYRPMDMTVSGFGCFPSPEKPRVIWAGCRIHDDLYVLQKKIETAVQTAGIEPEVRSFSPHLTLGRVRDSATSRNRSFRIDVKSAQDDLCSIGDETAQTVKSIRLYQSRLSSQGPTYTVLQEFHFSI